MNVFFLPRIAALKAIRIYQKTISPDHGSFPVFSSLGRCKYRPTCSQYAHEAIERHGLAKGAVMALWRLCRCNPFSKGGYDPVKEQDRRSN